MKSRKIQSLAGHHQTDWDESQLLLRQSQWQEHQYPITHPCLVVDTIQLLEERLAEVDAWLAHLQPSLMHESGSLPIHQL
jgi:hypothetical protein